MKKNFLILIIFTVIIFSELFGMNSDTNVKDYNLIYQEWKEELDKENPIKNFKTLSLPKLFLEENAKVLPFLMNKLKEGDTLAVIPILKISRVGVDNRFDLNILLYNYKHTGAKTAIIVKNNIDTGIIKTLLDWWEKDEKEIIEEFEKYYKEYQNRYSHISIPRYEDFESGQKVLLLGIAILPYLIENITKENYSKYSILIAKFTKKNFFTKKSLQLGKEGKYKLEKEEERNTIKEWWEENKSYWILSKSKKPPKEK